MTPRYGTSPERFWARVDKSGDCWLWTAGTDNHGYGRMMVNRVRVKAHRLSWEIHFGPIPDGLHVCHTCDTPACVRPEHLWLGTASENMHDMWAKGRHATPAPRPTRLTEAAVRAIREDARPIDTIAVEYGISRSHVSAVRLRKVWAWLD